MGVVRFTDGEVWNFRPMRTPALPRVLPAFESETVWSSTAYTVDPTLLWVKAVSMSKRWPPTSTSTATGPPRGLPVRLPVTDPGVKVEPFSMGVALLLRITPTTAPWPPVPAGTT